MCHGPKIQPSELPSEWWGCHNGVFVRQVPIVKRRIVVLEPKPHWTPELQRQFLEDDVHVQQCTQAADVIQRLRRDMVTVVVLPFDGQEASCMQLLAVLFEWQSVLSSIVIGSPKTMELEAPVKELGATLFLADRPSGHQLHRSCRRQLDSLLSAR